MSLGSAALCIAAATLCFAQSPNLAEIQSIYILSMGSGLDQYLANRLTEFGRFRVVTDPQLADAVLTDQIGRGFEDRMIDLYPPPPPPKPPEAQDEKLEKKKNGKTNEEDEPSMAALFGASSQMRTSSFSRGKGNIFLVDRTTKSVIWSTYLRARTSVPDDLNRTADEIVERLDKSAKKTAKMTLAAPPKNTPAQPPPPATAPVPEPSVPQPSAPAGVPPQK